MAVEKDARLLAQGKEISHLQLVIRKKNRRIERLSRVIKTLEAYKPWHVKFLEWWDSGSVTLR